MPITITQGLEN